MNVKALLEHFKADITCSICLGYFTDPVTVKCGHSFCTRCLFQCENEADAEFTCPECRQVIQISDLVPNKNLQNLSLMGSIIRPHLLQSMNICVQHWEKEKLFCEEDQRLLCESCSLAPEHKDHQVFPLDRAVDKCKDKIQETWGNLLDKKEKFQRQLNNETEKEARCKEDLHVLKLSVISEYEKMHIFLRDEKHVQMLKLDLEVKENLAKFNKSKTKLSQQIQNLQQMTLEVQKNLDKGPLEMLQAMKNTQERTEALLLQDPECAFPNRIAFQITGMSEILVSFQRDITLDPETADPQLTLSEDLKSVKYVDVPQDQTGNHKKFSHALRVLGAQRFTSGKHYWEVEVGDKTGWEVGICKESVNRKGNLSNLAGDTCTLMCVKSENRFCLWTSHNVFYLNQPIRKVGVFLDYEEGHIAFYDATDKSLIYSPPKIAFLGPLRPCFSLCLPNEETTPGSLTISSKSNQLKGCQ